MVPRLQIHAGDPDPLPFGSMAVHFRNVHRLCFIDDPALPPALHRHWAVSDDCGIQLVSQQGQIRPWLGAAFRHLQESALDPWFGVPGAFHAEGLAARPLSSSPDNPLHLVYSEAPADPLRGRGSAVYAVEPDGSRRLLAGTPGVSGHRDGPGGKALFGGIADLAMDREGTVYALDRGNRLVRRIDRAGKVTTLAGHAGRRTRGTAFEQPLAMVLDPATGDLYVADLHAIVRIAPDGEVRRILQAGDAHGTVGALEPPAHGFGRRVPSDPVHGLRRTGGLALQGRNLFIADAASCAVRVLDLDHGSLHTLAGGPGERRTRRGRLAYYSPDLPPGECAALGGLECVAFSTDGVCLVGLGTCLGHLDMPPFESPAQAARRKGAGTQAPLRPRAGKAS